MGKRVTTLLVLMALVIGASMHHLLFVDTLHMAQDVIKAGGESIRLKDTLLDRIQNIDRYISVQATQVASDRLESLMKGEVSEELRRRCREDVRRANKG